jgi:hypothetical protein
VRKSRSRDENPWVSFFHGNGSFHQMQFKTSSEALCYAELTLPYVKVGTDISVYG